MTLMNLNPQYVTDTAGHKVAVVLDIDSYQKLSSFVSSDAQLLKGLDIKTLRALAKIHLAIDEQHELNALLARNQEAILNPEEEGRLDALLAEVDELSVLKARALYTLHTLKQTNSYSPTPVNTNGAQ